MRVFSTVHPEVTHRAGTKQPVVLHIGGLRFQMTKSEALRLADALADAVEALEHTQ